MRADQQDNGAPLALRPLSYAVALAVLGMAGNALAQQAPAQGSELQLDRVVVTANKRAQNLQDVPAAITVLSDATLQRENVKGIDDLPNLSPAVTVSYSSHPGNYSINMRGIGTFSFGIGVESDVAVIVDDIPLAIQANAFKDLTDVFRIEVLKGPQSTLYGKSAIAGALNITTAPTRGPMQFKTSGYYSSDKESRLSATVTGSVSDTLSMRLAASKTNFDGLVNNLHDGSHLNGNAGQSLIGKFDWAPVEGLDVVISPRYNDTKNTCCVMPFTSVSPGGYYKKNPLLPIATVLPGVNFSSTNVDVVNDFPNGGNSHDAGLGVKVNYTFQEGSALADYTLSSITSYANYSMFDSQDGDGTATDVVQYETPAGFHGGLQQYGKFGTQARSQELRLTSPDKGAFRYVAGLWYGDNQLQRALTRGPITTYVTAWEATAFNTSYAAFGQSSWSMTDKTSLLTGVRFNREKIGYTYTRYTPPPAARVQTEYYQRDDTENKVTGRIGLEHQLTPDHMIYGLVSTGHKGAAYDLTSSFGAANAALPPVPGENAKNYELGAKLSLLNNRALVNLALFRTDFTGFQQSAGEVDADGIFRTTLHSIGALRTQGLEVDAMMKVSRELSLNAAIGLVDAKIRDFPNGPCYTVLNADHSAAVPNAACSVDPRFNNTKVQNLSGKVLPNAPKIKLNLGAQYELKLADQSFDGFLNGSYHWQSETQFGLNQDPGTIQGAYGIANLGLGIKDKGGRYTLSLFVNNLLDQRYAANLANTLANPTYSTASTIVNTTSWTPPRDYTRYFGVRLDLAFK
ncbi:MULTISPECIES: TonB-dependent receptor [unclassified Duganella]|uniref:TonB-dependent receptor n=1 Tax=unclassified Duganella TaxID=2636909 RepID=UPI0011C15923|nr:MULTISPECIES: TonB-dependent receptor [unclassified Duganella]